MPHSHEDKALIPVGTSNRINTVHLKTLCGLSRDRLSIVSAPTRIHHGHLDQYPYASRNKQQHPEQ